MSCIIGAKIIIIILKIICTDVNSLLFLLNLQAQSVIGINFLLIMDVSEVRQLFPALGRRVYGKPLVYFDNAATVQRPQQVMDEWLRMTSGCNANIHRAVHILAEEATSAYEQARDSVAKFINAPDRSSIIFTSGVTASINLVAFSFGEAFVSENDEVIVTEEEHHSNIVPWQMMCRRKKAVMKVLPVDENGRLKVELLEGMLTDRTRIVAVTHISNVLGIVNPVKDIVSVCHRHNVPVLVDGAQGVVHCKVDVRDLGCDFYAFSGHKIYAATGTGVLYGKKSLLDAMPPYRAVERSLAVELVRPAKPIVATPVSRIMNIRIADHRSRGVDIPPLAADHRQRPSVNELESIVIDERQHGPAQPVHISPFSLFFHAGASVPTGSHIVVLERNGRSPPFVDIAPFPI